MEKGLDIAFLSILCRKRFVIFDHFDQVKMLQHGHADRTALVASLDLPSAQCLPGTCAQCMLWHSMQLHMHVLLSGLPLCLCLPLRRVLSFSQDQHSWLCKAQVISLRFSLQCYQNYSRSGKSELGKSTKSKSKQEGQSCATSRAGEPLKYTEWNCTDTRWYPIIFAIRLPWKVSQLCIETGVIRLLRPLNCWPQMNHAPLCTHQSSCR